MNYLIAYLLTVVSSFGINTLNELRMYKDVANKGYIIDNNNRFRKENKIPKNISYLILLPVLNIITASKNLLAYDINRSDIIDNLDEASATIKMDEEEQKKYRKFPTGLTAGLLNIKEKSKLSDFASVKIDESSSIYYDLTDEGEFEIQKVTGPLSKRPVTDQIEALKNYREMLLKSQQINLTNQPRIRVRGK